MLTLKRFLKSFLLIELLKGLKLTMIHFFKDKVTTFYPEDKIPKSPRFRGLHALTRYSDGEEKCIACKLCESACPATAITIQSGRRYDGLRKTVVYEIDLFKCIYCGYCEEACPVDSIVQTSISDFCFMKKGEHIINKEQLLEIGDKNANSISENLKNKLL